MVKKVADISPEQYANVISVAKHNLSLVIDGLVSLKDDKLKPVITKLKKSYDDLGS